MTVIKVKKQKTKPKKPEPRKLRVQFPILEEPRTFSKREFNALVDYCSKISNEKWKFVFSTPDFMEITK